jgi:uncharacterized protein YqjF (DUF2071 family)
MASQRFLTAEWRKLIMANYEIDPALLGPWLPRGTELDHWKNKFYISLVGFMFKDVRVRGIRVPFHVDFPEVNLRFYVRYKDDNAWKRGVVFIKEIVPKPAITFIANTLFGERYVTLPMKSAWTAESTTISVSYGWKTSGKWNKIEVSAAATPVLLMPGSMEEFITEHFWGYSRINDHSTGEYRVDHPRWDVYNIIEHGVDCDFGLVYGREFSFLTSQVPASVFMAEGSKITVFKKMIIKEEQM